MKVLLVRLGVLGTAVVLGWITIANGQRGADTANPNPLRETTPSSEASPATRAPTSDPFGLQTRRETTAAAPEFSASADDSRSFPSAASAGISPKRPETAPSRYERTGPVDAAEPSAAGPSLTAGESNRLAAPVGFPRAEPSDRTARGFDNRDRASPASAAAPAFPAASATTDSREPAPFRADPSAVPASPLRSMTTTPNAFSAPANNSRVIELAAEAEGAGQPGDPRLDGAQSPQLMIQKFAPKEIQVGRTASFRVVVRNVGQVPAGEVEVRDMVPRGTRLVGTAPQATRGARGELLWTLGTLRPGEEAKVEMQLMPTAEGEIGSVATVHFGADASARSIATRPQLVIESAAPGKVMIGEQVKLAITISNPGTGVATGVVLTERIPPELRHPAGSELEYKVGDLKPGESRKLELPLAADRAGLVANMLSARGDGDLRAENKCQFEVIAPKLNVAVEGPKRRYLERQATYQFSVSNPGTASAKGIDLVASLPAGLKFTSANNAGFYDESTRTVRWHLEELPAGEAGSVELVAMPVEPGQHALKLRGSADKGLVVEKEQPVMVEGLAAILFQVADTADPLELGGETTYEVRVVNQGSKAAANVRLAVDLPAELKAVAAEGPTRHTITGNRLEFEGLAQLAPKAETVYRVRAKAMRAGDLRARFQLLTDDMQTPVTKEESTRVYADE